jgi:hypothetical protein
LAVSVFKICDCLVSKFFKDVENIGKQYGGKTYDRSESYLIK